MLKIFDRLLKLPPWLVATIAALAFATSGPAVAVALRELTPLWVVVGRCVLTVPLLWLMVGRQGTRAWRQLGWRGCTVGAASGVILALHLLCFVTAIAKTSFAAAIALVALEPLSVLGAGSLFFRIHPSRAQIIGILIAVLGTLLITLGQSSGTQHGHTLLGDLFALMAVLSYGIYYAVNRGFAKQTERAARQLPSLNQTAIDLAGAILIYAVCSAVGLLMIALFNPPLQWVWPTQQNTWIALFMVAWVATGIGHTISQIGSRRLAPIWVAIISPGETLGALLIGVIFLGNMPTWQEVVGGTVILSGVFLAKPTKTAKMPAHAPTAANFSI